jgi:hypothetical protein
MGKQIVSGTSQTYAFDRECVALGTNAYWLGFAMTLDLHVDCPETTL